jgi:DNA gyrase subunit A
VVKLGVLDLPTLPSTANHPNLQGGAPVGEFLTLDGERVLGLTGVDPGSPGLALGTMYGVVRRVNPEYLSARDDWDVISLKDGDEVVGAVELRTGDEALCFVTSDCQLLHFGAGLVRPQGRSGGGIAGIKLAAGARVVSITALEPETAVAVTVAGSASSLPGTEAGSVKVTPFSEYPGKGRATGGVRCQRLLKGEDGLVLAWVGAGPARAASANGVPVDLPVADGKRDGSGIPLPQSIQAVAGAASPEAAEATEPVELAPAAQTVEQPELS